MSLITTTGVAGGSHVSSRGGSSSSGHPKLVTCLGRGCSSHVQVTWAAWDGHVGASSGSRDSPGRDTCLPNQKSHSESPLVLGEVMSLISTTGGGSRESCGRHGRVTCPSSLSTCESCGHPEKVRYLAGVGLFQSRGGHVGGLGQSRPFPGGVMCSSIQ